MCIASLLFTIGRTLTPLTLFLQCWCGSAWIFIKGQRVSYQIKSYSCSCVSLNHCLLEQQNNMHFILKNMHARLDYCLLGKTALAIVIRNNHFRVLFDASKFLQNVNSPIVVENLNPKYFQLHVIQPNTSTIPVNNNFFHGDENTESIANKTSCLFSNPEVHCKD